ncbi:hypothetical protein R5R35_009213 [Gryllus longicercus]|uniref:Uncharacterized protein n=1 Tax=Gryllus longicercus TaxID=2509291 RepID=A0AAN9V1R2_9ORTH
MQYYGPNMYAGAMKSKVCHIT